jgi:NAD(P)-dependent dehydrogenase (short-subunit alcohol dehydrogenase family)
VLVTGGGWGIGGAVALVFAARAVAVLARTETELVATLRAIESAGGEGLAVMAEVTDYQAVVRAHAEVASALGPLVGRPTYPDPA